MSFIWPSFDSVFLNEVVIPIKKRSKSIKKKVKDISVQKVVEKEAGVEREKLEVELIFRANKVSARLFFWDDRYIWIDSRSPGKVGWDTEWGIEGRVGDFNANEFQSAFELSLAVWQIFSINSYSQLDNAWGAIALSGPSRN